MISLIDLLEQFTELRGLVSFLDQFILLMKEQQEKLQAKWREVWRDRACLPSSRELFLPDLCSFTSLEISFCRFQWRFHYVAMTDELIGHWWLNSIDSLKGRNGTGSSHHLLTKLAPLASRPHFGTFPELPYRTRGTFSPSQLLNFLRNF